MILVKSFPTNSHSKEATKSAFFSESYSMSIQSILITFWIEESAESNISKDVFMFAIKNQHSADFV